VSAGHRGRRAAARRRSAAAWCRLARLPRHRRDRRGDGRTADTNDVQSGLGQGATAFTASPVASGGHIYVATEDGEVYVVKAGPAFELVATNKLDAAMLATPAISEGRLFIGRNTRFSRSGSKDRHGITKPRNHEKA
jgi:hypothetical protein